MRIQIDIAPGELIDRISILEIKLKKIQNESKLTHVRNELNTLNGSLLKMRKFLEETKFPHKKLESLQYCTKELKTANEAIWDVLQKQRDLENTRDFGEKFIKVSLEVYHVNDRRALMKRKINELLDTDIAEVKEYTQTPIDSPIDSPIDIDTPVDHVEACNRLVAEHSERNKSK